MPTQIENHPKKHITVNGRQMAYVELGDPNGRPIIFQHGNPTSSYLWRNIMPHVQDLGRCIAIDLIGMGDSEKLPDSGPDRYTFAEHSAYFEAALEALGVMDNDQHGIVHHAKGLQRIFRGRAGSPWRDGQCRAGHS